MNNVTIIIPVYNEEKYIEQAVLSAVHQAECVIISDNHSDDRTGQICKKLAGEYKNIDFYEQSENKGGAKNFEFLVSKVKTEYMMNMGGHDVLEKNYIHELKQTLEQNQEAVLAYPLFKNINDEGEEFGFYDVSDLKNGIASNDVFVRVFTLIEKLTNCSVFFGLCRTSAFVNSLDFTPVMGIDHVILCRLASIGKFIQNVKTVFHRRYPERVNDNASYMRRITGAVDSSYDATYMCKKELDCISNIDCEDTRSKEYFIWRARKSLLKRFGRYCIQGVQESLDALMGSREKFILYGAGTISELVLGKMKDNILFIVDRDESKHGVNEYEIEIRDVDSMYETDSRIIISVMNETIFDELISAGIEYDRLIGLDKFLA